MRPYGKTKLGFFPLPIAEATRLKNWLVFPEPFSALDPCVGDGVAFAHFLRDVPAHRYGIEIDAYRAEQAQALGVETVQADAMDVRCPTESLSLLYLNPPYDWEAGASNNQRLESVFLEHTYRWLKPTGVLVFVIPQPRLAKCARRLSEHFTDLRVFRLTEPACLLYKQIVVLACRRKRHARLSDTGLLEGARCLEILAAKADLDPLGDRPDARYEVPTSEPVLLTNTGIPLDGLEDLLLGVSRLPSGQSSSSPQTTRRPGSAAHTAPWRTRGPALHCGNAQWGVRRRRRSSHRALAVGEVYRPLGRTGRRRNADPPRPGTVLPRVDAGFRQWKDTNSDP